ncbi:hypothetical protein ABN16_09745 [Levilactobacillus koreensis]|uniref:Uncharacterized protein n=1 Tax=Levilactobacillus koreensis TaxID=637971 RepID=A0AAC9ERH4_9LACO|nr:hypothetical protein ABN16_09745 [Levilactobacillus koreensis]
MEPAVTRMLGRWAFDLTDWDVLETRGLCGASRRVGSPFLGWKRSPWQAESLAAAGGSIWLIRKIN